MLRSFLSTLYRGRIRHLPLSAFDRAWARVEPHTMLGPRRLHRLWKSAHQVTDDSIPGDFVECGVARGGSAALVALAFLHAGARRKIWLFDTFEGLPAPSPEGDPDYEEAAKFTGLCRGELADVQALLRDIDPALDLQPVKGLYQDTLLAAAPERIAFLHVDADWYESVKICLETLYDRVSPGGIVQLDDYYSWQGCRRAADEFFVGERATTFHRIDGSAVWLRKSG